MPTEGKVGWREGGATGAKAPRAVITVLVVHVQQLLLKSTEECSKEMIDDCAIQALRPAVPHHPPNLFCLVRLIPIPAGARFCPLASSRWPLP